MKALRPKMGDKAAQKELIGAIKDPAMRDQIVGMIAQSEAPAEEAPAAEASSEPTPEPEQPPSEPETPSE